jgi:hypothetical protein
MIKIFLCICGQKKQRRKYTCRIKVCTRFFENKTSKEMFLGEKLEFNHFRIFGCTVFVHVPKEKRTKLVPSTWKDIFFGYSGTSKAYRIYITVHQKVEIN